MLQLAIALLFAFAGIISLGVIVQTLGRAQHTLGEVRAALAEFEEAQPATVRSISVERRPVICVIQSARASRRAPTRSMGYPLAVAA